MKKNNIILMSDSYKLSHWKQYPEGMIKVYSYLESRGGKYPKTLFFGLRYFLIQLEGIVVTSEDVEEADKFSKEHFGSDIFNKDGWEYIVKRHGGKLPLRIKAVKEGSLVETNNVLMTIENTDPNCYWLTNVIETYLLKIWYPITVATNSFYAKKIINYYLSLSANNTDSLPFKLHDFGYRGVSSEETAGLGAMAHLINFMGTDTLAGITYANKYYDANGMIAFSVPASEHSVACSYGPEMEEKYFLNMLEQYPTGIVSIVSDTYNVFNFVGTMGVKFKEKILSREGTVVFRPDCYSEDTQILTKSGWKYFKDLNKDEEVAQVLENGEYEFTKPLKYYNKKYDGEMIKYYDFYGKVDLLVTPNHRMVFDKGNGFEIQEAKDCNFYWKKNVVRSAKAKNNNKKLLPLEALKIAFQADGSYTTSGNKIRFLFSKERKIERLKLILNNANISFNVYNLSDNRVEFNVNINSDDFLKNFSWIDISNLDGNWCKEFIEELSYWDATRRHENRFKFDTTNKNVIDIVEIIALSAGYGCYIVEKEDDRKDIFSNVFTAHIMKNNKLGGQSIKKETINYNGNVYCVQVPSGKLLVKRNKSQLVCGNSGDPIEVNKELINILWNVFGKYGTITTTGHKLLPSQVRLIQGDGIDNDILDNFLFEMTQLGYSAENWVFGSGGGLLQKFDRDTQKFAIKASYGEREIWGSHAKIINRFPISKNPVTSKGKKSKAGQLKLVKNSSGYNTVTSENKELFKSSFDELELVFENGEIKRKQTFEEIRELANESMNNELMVVA